MDDILLSDGLQSKDASLENFEVFPWGSGFETGIKVIDQEHQTLVRFVNALANALVHDDVTKGQRILEQLIDYAKYHFDSEEAIWEKYFPDDEWGQLHRQEHALLVSKVLKFGSEGRSNLSRSQLEHAAKFLISWLTTHILEDDMRMAIAARLIEEGQDRTEAKSNANKKMQSAATVLIDSVLAMYGELSSSTMELMRERIEHQKSEKKLHELNKELEYLAVTDQLTGLRNRRSFDKVFSRELRRAQRNRSRLAFMMLDIDYFKRLNDQYGHNTGDAALKAIGDKLNQLFRRAGDYVFRLGGEEFAILITDPALIDGANSAERVRRGIQSLNFPNYNSDISDCMTISVGMVNKIAEMTDDVENFLKLADKRLYQAKTEGRNRVVAA